MKTLTSIFVFFLFAFFSAVSTTGQDSAQDPGHKSFAEVSGIRFSVPKYFKVEKSPDSQVAFMRYEESGTAVFIAARTGHIDEHLLTDLTSLVAGLMLPKSKHFRWKVSHDDMNAKAGKFEIARGTIKGLDKRKRFVQIYYHVVKIKEQEVVAGYITELGEGSDPEFLFNLPGIAGGSMPGADGLEHILTSITGKKYEAPTLTGTKKN